MSTAYRWGRAGAAAVLLIGTLLVSGCGSGATTSEPDSTSPTSAASSVPVTSATVDVKDMQFSPDSVTLKVGGTVTWKFADRFPHAVQGIGDSAMGINSPIFNEGQWSHTFAVPGTYRYLCPLHPDMHGTITVVQ